MDILSETKQKMQKSLEVIKNDIATIRTGRATPALVDTVVVGVYGGSARMRILELGSITAPDNQTLLITPFDGSILHEINKGLLEANLGFTPVVDGPSIRISIPPLSSERRQEYVKLMQQKLEHGRVMIRQIRQDSMSDVKKAEADGDISEDEQKRLEKQIQTETDNAMSEIEKVRIAKEAELMRL